MFEKSLKEIIRKKLTFQPLLFSNSCRTNLLYIGRQHLELDSTDYWLYKTMHIFLLVKIQFNLKFMCYKFYNIKQMFFTNLCSIEQRNGSINYKTKCCSSYFCLKLLGFL